MSANVFSPVASRKASAAIVMAVVLAGVVGRGLAMPAVAGDWPQILGPARNGTAAADERLADRWPAGGPPTVWRRPVGGGYAGVAVAGPRVVLFHREGGREVVESLDAATGRAVWTDSHPTTFDLPPLNSTTSRERIWGWSKPREATNATRKEGTSRADYPQASRGRG